MSFSWTSRRGAWTPERRATGFVSLQEVARAYWPLALLVILLAPLVWLLSLPLRLLGVAIDAVFALLRAILTVPARLLGGRG